MIPAVVVDPAVDDEDVIAALGDGLAFFKSGERNFKVGSMSWSLVANTEDENWETSLVQIDFWTRSMEKAVTLLGALRRLLHHETQVTIGGEVVWSKFVAQRDVRSRKDGIWEGSLDVELTYIRARRLSA